MHHGRILTQRCQICEAEAPVEFGVCAAVERLFARERVDEAAHRRAVRYCGGIERVVGQPHGGLDGCDSVRAGRAESCADA